MLEPLGRDARRSAGAGRPDSTPAAGRAAASARGFALRAAPYPYRALLAICSDLDETPDARVYAEIARFLNTRAATAMGPGVGLEVGNTLYFDMPPGQFAYWNTDDAGRAMAQALLRSGHIDCLHSFGDLATTRAHAARALDELARRDCRLEVWVDHAIAPTNFGADIMRGQGDVPGAPAYHADLTHAFGMRYVWRGRVTSVIGQDVPARLNGLFHPRNPAASAKTIAKELAKRALARLGSRKYALQRDNRVLHEATLRDGRRVLEFIRCNWHWGGVSCGDTARGIADVLTDAALDTLARRRGAAVLYTHLGKIEDPARPFNPATAAAFERLAERQRRGQIRTLTTRRLLGYLRARDGIRWQASDCGAGLARIDIDTRSGAPDWPLPRRDLQGLTFYVPAHVQRAELVVDGEPYETVAANPPDDTGRASVSAPLGKLEFPDW